MQRQQALSHAEVKASLCAEVDCPLLDAPAQESFTKAVRAASDFSLRCATFLQKRSPAEQAAWVRQSLGASRTLFSPWTMEVLYAIAAAGTARFTLLQDLLGLSSRTLAERLASLAEAGLVERIVEPGPPLRTGYKLTKDGRATAALAAPLFAHLNQAANERRSGTRNARNPAEQVPRKSVSSA